VLQAAAVSVIFVHNHPSGDPTPSEADLAITERLCRAGEVLGIAVLDHVVLGGTDYFSFADAGILAGLTAAGATGRTP
jgi:DNA repair protein RadC